MHAIVERSGNPKLTAVAALAALLVIGAPGAAHADASRGTAAASDPNTVVLNVAGDLAYPASWGGWQYVESQKHLLYRQIQRILDSADLNFVNVECPLTDAQATAEKTYPIRCKPHQIPYFVDAGFNMLSLANNHSIDVGTVGITDTLENLARVTTPERPLWWAGTGASSDDARLPARITVPGKNLVISFFAVANTSGGGKVAGLHDKSLPDRVAEAAKHSDIVMVSVHHGPEYHHKPWSHTVDKYHALIDAGATMVVAHHPHVVQGFERYKKGFIFYSLGNFSFASRTNRHLPTAARLYSVIGRMTLRRTGNGAVLDRVELIPLYANNKATWTLEGMSIPARHAEPQLLAGPFAQLALDEFVDFSDMVPGGAKTSFLRVGDRLFADLGHGEFSAEEKRRLIAQQKHEYRAVIEAGAAPRPATEGEKARKQRAGTPWPPANAARAAEKRAKTKSKKVRGKRRGASKAGKRRSNRRSRR